MGTHREGLPAQAFATALLFSGSYVAGKYATGSSGPLFITLCRYAIALLFLRALRFDKRHRYERMDRCDVWRFAALALFGVVGYHYFFFVSLRYTDISHTAIINALSPVVTALMAICFIRERLRFAAVVGMLLAVSGVMILLGIPSHGFSQASYLNLGDVSMLVSVVCWAVYALIVKSMIAKYSGVTISYYVTLIGVIILIFLTPAEIDWSKGMAGIFMDDATFWSVAYMGIFASGLGYLLYNHSIQRIGATMT